MKVIILAGGLGTRLGEMTEKIPKPMIELDGKPILWHIMNIFSEFGHNDFYIATGYKSYVIEKYFEEEVKPHLPHSWMDRSKDKIGYEINFAKEFFKYKKLKDLNVVLKEIEILNQKIESDLKNL